MSLFSIFIIRSCRPANRFLSHSGVFAKADTKWSTATPSSECTKCGLVVTPLAEFHKHILECGGDTNWMATMYTPTKKHKYVSGSRRAAWDPRVRYASVLLIFWVRFCAIQKVETLFGPPATTNGDEESYVRAQHSGNAYENS